MSFRRKKEQEDSEDKVTKKYTQFSKKVVALCIVNLFAIEVFAMYMIAKTDATDQISYLVTAIAAECLACVVWYMKNSEGEKKARIQAEIEKEKLKLNSPDNQSISTPQQNPIEDSVQEQEYDNNPLYETYVDASSETSCSSSIDDEGVG
jgi:hypothetical protein